MEHCITSEECPEDCEHLRKDRVNGKTWLCDKYRWSLFKSALLAPLRCDACRVSEGIKSDV